MQSRESLLQLARRHVLQAELRMRTMIVALVLLMGCASPGDVWHDGAHVTLRSAHPVRVAARCIADNAERAGGHVMARERLEDDGTAEVIVRATVLGSTNVMAVAKVVPDDSGSLVDLATAPDAITPGRMRATLLKGC
jgi:hypothetical protein